MRFKTLTAALLAVTLLGSLMVTPALAENDYQLTNPDRIFQQKAAKMDEQAFTSGSFGSPESTGNIGGKIRPGDYEVPGIAPDYLDYYEYTDGTIQWELRDGVLVFTGTGGFPDCLVARGPFTGNPYIETVIVGPGIKYLNGRILQKLPNLKTLIVLDGHTVVEHAAEQCPNLSTAILGADLQNKNMYPAVITPYGETQPKEYIFSTLLNHYPGHGCYVLDNVSIVGTGDYSPFYIKDGKVPVFHNYDPTAAKRCTLFATEALNQLNLLSMQEMKAAVKPVIDGLPQFAKDLLPAELTTGGSAHLPQVHPQVSNWAKADVARAREEGLIPVTIPFDLTQNITREQFCELAVALYEKVAWTEIKDRKTFSDTKNPSVEKLAAMGVINGVGDGLFAPKRQLTRAQAATILSRLGSLMDLDMSGTYAPFQDTADSWAAADIARVYQAHIMNGTSATTFSPESKYTIQQAVVTFLRMLDAYNHP